MLIFFFFKQEPVLELKERQIVLIAQKYKTQSVAIIKKNFSRFKEIGNKKPPICFFVAAVAICRQAILLQNSMVDGFMEPAITEIYFNLSFLLAGVPLACSQRL